MPRFAILSHDHPFPHWDLLLEWGDACRTWRLLAKPAANAEIPAEKLPDHRLHYLDYEGPVSGGRGTVTRSDAGRFELLAESPQVIHVHLVGSSRSREAVLRLVGDHRWVFQESDSVRPPASQSGSS